MTMRFNWNIHARVDKYIGPEADARAAAGLAPDDVALSDGNLITTAGLTRLTSLLTGAGGQAYDATHARIGVGDSSTAALVGDTALGAVTNKYYKTVTGAPSLSGGVMTFVAIFPTGQANFAWNEWGIDQGGTDGTTVVAPLLNHRIASLGTKTSAAAWTFTCTVTES